VASTGRLGRLQNPFLTHAKDDGIIIPTMNLLSRLRQFRDRLRPRPLDEWFHITFDAKRVHIQAEPPGQTPWSQEFAWSDVERIVFKTIH